MAKVATIKEFSGMEDNGLFYVEGFSPQRVNGKSVLVDTYLSQKVATENDTGFTGMQIILGMTKLDHKVEGHVIGIDSYGSLFDFHPFNSSYNLGKVHSVSATTHGGIQIIFCQGGDVFTTKNQNIIFSLAESLGYGVRGQCASTSTTQIVDKDGRNWETLLKMSSDLGSWNNKVVNLNTGEEFTVTSISTTTYTNDTLNFTAGANTNTLNDYFMVFSEVGGNNGGFYWDFFKTTLAPHFTGQEAPTHFKRQIKLFEGNYIIGNGNWLSALNEDETTWNDNFKQLPTGTQFQCMDVNQGRILVGGDFNGKGKIMLWDGYTDGWLSIIETSKVPTAITKHSNGWVIAMGAKIYFTNGYTITLISSLPGRDYLDAGASVPSTALMSFEDKIFLLPNLNNFVRGQLGVYMYDFKSGWIFTPFYSGIALQYSTEGYPGCIKEIVYQTLPMVVYTSSVSASDSTNHHLINKMQSGGNNTSSVIIRLDLDEKVNFKEVVLKVGGYFDTSIQNLNNSTITVNYGDGNKKLLKSTQTGNGCTTTSIVNNGGNYDYMSGTVGNEVKVSSGDAGGERTYITAIANKGTTTETWTISPALSHAITDSSYTRLYVYNLKKAGSHVFGETVNSDGELRFNVEGIRSDALWIEVVLESNNYRTYLSQIDVYAD